MAKIYNRYVCNIDHTWYDSSNIVYSACFDNPSSKSLKIVFKGGATYLYRDVDPIDYLLFRDGESNGKVFNEKLRKLPCTKLYNTDLNALEQLKQQFITQENESYNERNYRLVVDEKTGNFEVYLNNVKCYEGVEGQVSIINLLSSMKLPYTMETKDVKLKTITEFENESIV
jgi:hypothetical protein